jgi:hypothetical protein
VSKITGRIVDKLTGQPVEACVQVLSSDGHFLGPTDAVLKVGPGLPFFYSDGSFTVDAPRGVTSILVERGTEYTPARINVDAPSQGVLAVDVELDRWSGLARLGWHPGNTHIHYREDERRPDERLRLDPRVHDLRFTAISILKRRDLPYASNKYAPGVLTEFCSAHHYVECGEESRHNSPRDSIEEGYGHIMLLRIKDVVEPLSRGYLVDDVDPDYPPLCYACDDTHRQGGVVLWCHNGKGMEAPIAAALGKLDAFNLFDPWWMDPEYDIWYQMLNCGLHLPASTGSDWFISSANRVYAYTGGEFAVDDWIGSLKSGKTFITNGPAVLLTVNDQLPGSTVVTAPDQHLSAIVQWTSHYAIERVEIIWNGKVIASNRPPAGATSGILDFSGIPPSDGWLAARLYSTRRDSFWQPIYAHSSPVYVKIGVPAYEQRDAAAAFVHSIEHDMERIRQSGRFQNDRQRHDVLDLFEQGKSVYERITS